MKNMIFKVVGACLFFSAMAEARNAADMAMNGSESRVAKSFDNTIEAIRERRRKHSKPDDDKENMEEAEV